jgi:hypothetical protein
MKLINRNDIDFPEDRFVFTMGLYSYKIDKLLPNVKGISFISITYAQGYRMIYKIFESSWEEFVRCYEFSKNLTGEWILIKARPNLERWQDVYLSCVSHRKDIEVVAWK